MTSDEENRALIREAAELIRTSKNLGGTGKSLDELRGYTSASEERVRRLEAVAEAAEALMSDRTVEAWDSLYHALRAAGYLKETGE
jgi:hypothetical protein